MAVAEGETTAVIDGLRIVGERASLVRRTWQRLGHDLDFEIAPIGA